MPPSDEYPSPYVSDWMDDGSMTIDLGQQFTFAVDEEGFHATRERGTWSPDDLYFEMDYWPESLVWAGANERLNILLNEVAEAGGYSPNEVRELVVAWVGGQRIDLASYLEKEDAANGNSEELTQIRANSAALHRSYEVLGLPSDAFQEGTCYRGLELSFDEKGWSARLLEPDESDGLFQPVTWSAPTFDELLEEEDEIVPLEETLPWSPEELEALLIKSDKRWGAFL